MLMTTDETARLVKTAQIGLRARDELAADSGDEPQRTTALRAAVRAGDDATDALVREHQGLVYSVARRMALYEGFEDAVQDGMTGLLRAIKTFDPEKGLWSVYATLWIRQHIQYGTPERTRVIIVPLGVWHDMNKIKPAITETGTRDAAVLAAATGIRESRVARALTAIDSPISLDAVFTWTEDGVPLYDRLPDEDATAPAAAAEEEDTVVKMRAALGMLDERSQRVLTAMHGIGCEQRTTAELAEELGVSRVYVNKIARLAMTQLQTSEAVASLR